MSRGVFFVLYGIVLAVGVWWIGLPPHLSDLTIVAKRNLAANHLIQSGDLAVRVDGVHYLVREVKRHEPVPPDNIVSRASGAVAKDHVRYSLPVGRDQVRSGMVNAGSEVLICPVTLKVKLHSVLCPAGTGACLAVADLNEEEAAKLKGIETFKLSVGNSCG